MTTPRRRKPPAVTPAPLLPVSVDTLADFLAIEHPDRERLGRGIDIAITAATSFIGEPVAPDALPHTIRHGIHILAAQLLLADQLERVPAREEIPAVIRALWSHANAGPAPV